MDRPVQLKIPGGYYVTTQEENYQLTASAPPSSMHQRYLVGGEVTNSLLCQVLRLWLNKDVWGRWYAPSYVNCCVSYVSWVRCVSCFELL